MKIIFKNVHEIVIREEEVAGDEYYSEPDYIQRKFVVKEVYENENRTEFTIFNDGNISHDKILQNENTKGLNVSIGHRTYLGIFRHEKFYHYDGNGILSTISNQVLTLRTM